MCTCPLIADSKKSQHWIGVVSNCIMELFWGTNLDPAPCETSQQPMKWVIAFPMHSIQRSHTSLFGVIVLTNCTLRFITPWTDIAAMSKITAAWCFRLSRRKPNNWKKIYLKIKKVDQCWFFGRQEIYKFMNFYNSNETKEAAIPQQCKPLTVAPLTKGASLIWQSYPEIIPPFNGLCGEGRLRP